MNDSSFKRTNTRFLGNSSTPWSKHWSAFTCFARAGGLRPPDPLPRWGAPHPRPPGPCWGVPAPHEPRGRSGLAHKQSLDETVGAKEAAETQPADSDDSADVKDSVDGAGDRADPKDAEDDDDVHVVHMRCNCNDCKKARLEDVVSSGDEKSSSSRLAAAVPAGSVSLKGRKRKKVDPPKASRKRPKRTAKPADVGKKPAAAQSSTAVKKRNVVQKAKPGDDAIILLPTSLVTRASAKAPKRLAETYLLDKTRSTCAAFQ